MKKIREFYERIKSSKFKTAVLMVSLVILFVGITRDVVSFVINSLIYNTPRPANTTSLDSNFLNHVYVVVEQNYLIVGIIGILLIVLLQFMSDKIRNNNF